MARNRKLLAPDRLQPSNLAASPLIHISRRTMGQQSHQLMSYKGADSWTYWQSDVSLASPHVGPYWLASSLDHQGFHGLRPGGSSRSDGVFGLLAYGVVCPGAGDSDVGEGVDGDTDLLARSGSSVRADDSSRVKSGTANAIGGMKGDLSISSFRIF
ncbi:hypothetical protein N656DRAFT_103032 [Canariomyces notabilis]|uniref:Uncharacterized protein n=1 Tax=Canariomyces notabilis TaxID=2074819 RepID=A0AAN6YSJ6_9PEZI|nr:hypothetical protein N656DRAFT_103032 [Canariomyces arenarius]